MRRRLRDWGAEALTWIKGTFVADRKRANDAERLAINR